MLGEERGVGSCDGWIGLSALDEAANPIRVALVPCIFVVTLHELSEVEAWFCFRSSEERCG